MKNNKERLQFLKRGQNLTGDAATGISLHCHTLHSKELLDFVPYYAERIPVVKHLWQRSLRRQREMYGSEPDFKSGYWEPPLTGTGVLESETQSISGLGLETIISITDHDSIQAGLDLQHLHAPPPISMEWTVPFENAFFHVGIHNLPPESAEHISTLLLEYTNSGTGINDRWLDELLNLLNEAPGVLIVLNHPIWDIEMIGQKAHERALAKFLVRHGERMHAIEVNGFRSRAENQAAIELADSLSLPVISGGDRHCCQPNTMINITDASNFTEFVDEIRVERRSRVAVLPEYNVPLPSRQLASIAQILGGFEGFPEGRRLWAERIFLDSHDGLGLRTLSDKWSGKPPMWTAAALAALRLLALPAMRPLIGAFVGDTDIGRNEITENGDHPEIVNPLLIANS